MLVIVDLDSQTYRYLSACEEDAGMISLPSLSDLEAMNIHFIQTFILRQNLHRYLKITDKLCSFYAYSTIAFREDYISVGQRYVSHKMCEVFVSLISTYLP